METTIQVDKSTVQLLNRLKGKYSANSYNRVIQLLIYKEEKMPKKLFGAHPDLKPFKREKEDFHDL